MAKLQRWKWAFLFSGALFLLPFLYHQNNSLEITFISPKTPSQNNPIKVLHLSDLQSKHFGDHQKKIISKIEKIKPEMIVFTGDLVDAFHYEDVSWRELASKLPTIAPTYFVSGNHEWWKGNFSEVAAFLVSNGVNVLRNETITLSIKNRGLTISGVDDPEAWQGDKARYLGALQRINSTIKKGETHLLLVHRPEFFEEYDKTHFTWVFAGHAHGGQFRFPLVGGLLAPNQGLFPKYSAGLYAGKMVKMVVSRGLGNSVFPLRLFNRPELVVVEV
jgi:predicted MPP superfamily phosphohydrolase